MKKYIKNMNGHNMWGHSKRIELNSTEKQSRDMTYKIINDNCQSENKLTQ